MEAHSVFLLGAVICAGVGGFLIALAIAKSLMQSFRSQKIQNRSGIEGSVFTSFLRHGISFLRTPSRLLLSIPFFERYGKNVEIAFSGKLEKQGVISAEAFISFLLAVTLAVFVLSMLVSGSLVCGIALSVCVWLAVGLWTGHQCDLRREQLREAIPEALQSMKACFQVGYTLAQTVREVRKSTSGPLSELFREVEGVLETGGNTEDALSVFKKKADEPELVFLATALEIQHKTGSSMQQVLEITRQSVSDEIELKRTLKTQTAQAKLSAQIVTIMPFALIGLFSLVSPGFLDPFFESVIGVVLLVVALSMQLLGVMLVRRLLKVEVA